MLNNVLRARRPLKRKGGQRELSIRKERRGPISLCVDTVRQGADRPFLNYIFNNKFLSLKIILLNIFNDRNLSLN